MTTFDKLPIACIVNGRYLCIHGGISPHLAKVSDINKINRQIEVPQNGGLCDLVWSDPINNSSGAMQ